ncbi:unnamed protein product [Arctogadus glacialis]
MCVCVYKCERVCADSILIMVSSWRQNGVPIITVPALRFYNSLAERKTSECKAER